MLGLILDLSKVIAIVASDYIPEVDHAVFT